MRVIFKKESFFMNIFGAMTKRMEHEAFRLRVVSENVANMHTPQYKARIPKHPAIEVPSAFKVHMWKTQPNHLSPGSQSRKFETKEDPDSYVESLTGNTVNYERELQRANDANQKERQMNNIITAELSMLSNALRK